MIPRGWTLMTLLFFWTMFWIKLCASPSCWYLDNKSWLLMLRPQEVDLFSKPWELCWFHHEVRLEIFPKLLIQANNQTHRAIGVAVEDRLLHYTLFLTLLWLNFLLFQQTVKTLSRATTVFTTAQSLLCFWAWEFPLLEPETEYKQRASIHQRTADESAWFC